MNGSPSLRNRINATVRDIPRSGIRDFFDIVSTMKDVISLGIGEPDFDTPWHVRESTVFALERGATHYTSNLRLPRTPPGAGQIRSARCSAPNTIRKTKSSSPSASAKRWTSRCARCSTRATKCSTTSRATCRIAPRYCSRTACRWRWKRKSENGFRLTRAMLEAKVHAEHRRC